MGNFERFQYVFYYSKVWFGLEAQLSQLIAFEKKWL